MANMRIDQELTLKAAGIATRAPQEWALFIGALKGYADSEAMKCVQSSPDSLQRMQGRAQQCAELLALLQGAVKSADRIATKTAGASTAANHRRSP